MTPAAVIGRRGLYVENKLGGEDILWHVLQRLDTFLHRCLANLSSACPFGHSLKAPAPSPGACTDSR